MSINTPIALSGVYDKLARANELIAGIEEQLRSLLASGQFRVEGRPDHERRRYCFTAYGEPLPLRFSVLAGEVVHHLRSCLDHLVWQLVLANGQEPAARNDFPVCDKAKDFTEACRKGKLQGISPAAITKIESLQPYHTTPIENNWPWVVHELDRIDKHRLLVVLLAVVGVGERVNIGSKSGLLEIIGMAPPDREVPTPDGTEVFSISFGKQYQRDVRVEPEFVMELVFEQVGSISRVPLLPALRGALVNITQLVTSFQSDFPTS